MIVKVVLVVAVAVAVVDVVDLWLFIAALGQKLFYFLLIRWITSKTHFSFFICRCFGKRGQLQN
jgi:hypothetical protein